MSKFRKAHSQERSEEWKAQVYDAKSLEDSMVFTKDGEVVFVGDGVGRMPDGSLYVKPDEPEEEDGEETIDIATGEDYYDPVVRKVDDGTA